MGDFEILHLEIGCDGKERKVTPKTLRNENVLIHNNNDVKLYRKKQCSASKIQKATCDAVTEGEHAQPKKNKK